MELKTTAVMEITLADRLKKYALIVLHGNQQPGISDTGLGLDFRSAVQHLLDNVHQASLSADHIASMDRFINAALERMPSSSGLAAFHWRLLYTDASILKALARATTPVLCEDTTRECISILDRAIVVAGAATDEDRRDYVVNDLIRQLQSAIPWHPPSRAVFIAKKVPIPDGLHPPTSKNTVRTLAAPPSVVAAPKDWSRAPFVIKGYADDWPALHEPRQWASLEYLFSVAGPGRIVPVEVGADYRSDDWSPKLLPWEEFLSSLDPASVPAQHHTLYLAQHNLLTQFPRLREDIILPDIVYSYVTSPDFPDYEPPPDVIVNAWLGPKGTVSPAHTDPFFNCYVQVVGCKTVWLAPPNAAAAMYPYDSSLSGADRSHNPAANTANPLLSNTSRVDVFTASTEAVNASQKAFPFFWKTVPDTALCVTLDPGDLLFFPPGWWHAMRSEDVSFSVSMWF